MTSLQEILIYVRFIPVVPVVITLAMVFFLWGMATFILNAGNEEKRIEGKRKMIWGIIALTVIIGVWGIVTMLIVAFNITNVFPALP